MCHSVLPTRPAALLQTTTYTQVGFRAVRLPVHTFNHSACRNHSDYEWGMVGFALLAERSKKVPQLVAMWVWSQFLFSQWPSGCSGADRSVWVMVLDPVLRKLCSSFIWLLTKSCVGLQLSKLMSPLRPISKSVWHGQNGWNYLFLAFHNMKFAFLASTWIFSVQGNHCIHRLKLCDFPSVFPIHAREINSLIPYIVLDG